MSEEEGEIWPPKTGFMSRRWGLAKCITLSLHKCFEVHCVFPSFVTSWKGTRIQLKNTLFPSPDKNGSQKVNALETNTSGRIRGGLHRKWGSNGVFELPHLCRGPVVFFGCFSSSLLVSLPISSFQLVS